MNELLKQYNLDYLSLKRKLFVSFIRGSGKGGQKRNKTSSTAQVIDSFNYLPYIPHENKKLYKGVISIKVDIGRNREENLQRAVENWNKTLLKFFTVQKERTIDLKKEKKRRERIKQIEMEEKKNLQYRNRKYM